VVIGDRLGVHTRSLMIVAVRDRELMAVVRVGPALVHQQFMEYGPPIPDTVLTEIVDDILLPLG